MDLSTQDWKAFNIQRTDNQAGLFIIENCKCGSAGELVEGNDINYIGAKKTDNGVMRKVETDVKLVSKGHGILFICDGEGSVGYTNYMDKDFIGSTTTSIGYDEALTEINAMFIVTVLDSEKFKYSYGRKYRVHLKDTKVYLPIKHNSEGIPYIDKTHKYSGEGYVPDWQFMEDYIRSLRCEPITTMVENENVAAPDVEQWEEFRVGKIFTLLNGKGITKEEIECNLGDLPAIQSGEENNGVLGKISEAYCKEMNYTMTKKACLTVARTGSAGFVSYQGAGCVVGDSAKILLLEDEVANVYVYMFLQTMLTANRFKYDYGRKVTESKYLDDVLKLPIQRDDKGDPVIDAEKKYSEKGYIPDWEYMKKYIKMLPYSDRI